MSSGQTRRTCALRGATTALLLSLMLGGCGGGDDEGKAAAKPLGQELAGSVAHLAQCKDWVGGTRERKLATIDDIRAQVNRRGHRDPVAAALRRGGAGPLRPTPARTASRAASGLYVLYARAAGFAPLTRGPPAQ